MWKCMDILNNEMHTDKSDKGLRLQLTLLNFIWIISLLAQVVWFKVQYSIPKGSKLMKDAATRREAFATPAYSNSHSSYRSLG
jgi:hypothetical protein